MNVPRAWARGKAHDTVVEPAMTIACLAWLGGPRKLFDGRLHWRPMRGSSSLAHELLHRRLKEDRAYDHHL